MNIDQKLTALRDIIQRDIGGRGLANDSDDNLLNACPNDFANACRSIAEHPRPCLAIVTGFFIPRATPPAFETDGPLGAQFLIKAMEHLEIPTEYRGPVPTCFNVSHIGLTPRCSPTHAVYIERHGPAADDGYYTMSGIPVTEHVGLETFADAITIGIGDGGNEIGMGKIPHETIVKNIPNGDLIHCRIATDHLIVAGASNWGAYALAAGIALLRGVRLPEPLFDPDRERERLRVMVEAGPLVDGVTGQPTATVDGLSWSDYIQPLVEIGRIVRS